MHQKLRQQTIIGIKPKGKTKPKKKNDAVRGQILAVMVKKKLTTESSKFHQYNLIMNSLCFDKLIQKLCLPDPHQ